MMEQKLSQGQPVRFPYWYSKSPFDEPEKKWHHGWVIRDFYPDQRIDVEYFDFYGVKKIMAFDRNSIKVITSQKEM